MMVLLRNSLLFSLRSAVPRSPSSSLMYGRPSRHVEPRGMGNHADGCYFLSREKVTKERPLLSFFIGYRRQDRRVRGSRKSRGDEEDSTFDTFGKIFVKVLLNLWWNLHNCKILVIFVVEKER